MEQIFTFKKKSSFLLGWGVIARENGGIGKGRERKEREAPNWANCERRKEQPKNGGQMEGRWLIGGIYGKYTVLGMEWIGLIAQRQFCLCQLINVRFSFHLTGHWSVHCSLMFLLGLNDL